MAKSLEQKRKEAIARAKLSYHHKVAAFLVLCPSLLNEDLDDIDFSIWLNHFDSMRRVAKELGILWTGGEGYSTIESWSLRQIIESWIRKPDEYMNEIDKLSVYLIDRNQHVPHQSSRTAWAKRNEHFKRIFELPQNQALVDQLDNK